MSCTGTSPGSFVTAFVVRLDGSEPAHLIGDTAYGTAGMLGWMVDEKTIEPHVPVWDKAERKDGSLGRFDFRWEAETDEYLCPQNKPLRSTGKATADDTLIYRSTVYDCAGCELKSRCCPNTTHDEFLLAATAQNLRRMAAWLMPKGPGSQIPLASISVVFPEIGKILVRPVGERLHPPPNSPGLTQEGPRVVGGYSQEPIQGGVKPQVRGTHRGDP